ncbi:phytoene desaturase family protein [Paractinoplanes durhamensis]|uniref:Phytoene desaturase n=1 Tax=Paractinoplanes durhamensis TaxID=113563 RepID=A0ABQ3Z3N8_9ACTN|nr:FAD-dependent oxidoreductase [Actinoplanes durhamensis]GIE04414.1 phytoene desaturase [Actinoplanes durhamensis]
MSRIVVVGAGVGGLAAAIRLASAGHDVEVHERSAGVGGKLAVHERDGFRFDTGPSLLTLPQVFADLGLRLPELQPLDPVVRHFFPGGAVLDSSSVHEVFLERIADALGAGAAADWNRFWRRAERIWQASWRSVLQRPVTPASLASLSWRLTDLAAIAPGRTLRDLSLRYLRDPRLRMLLDRYATYTGADPRRAPAALAAIPYAELHFGGWYLPGGLGTLGTAMVDRCTELGARIVTNSPVTAILTAEGRATGVAIRGGQATAAEIPGGQATGAADPGGQASAAILGERATGAGGSGRRIDADIVVSDVDALALYRDLLPTPGRLAALTDRSLAGFVMLLGIRGETPELAHHNVFFPSWYDAEFNAIFGSASRRAGPAGDPTIFVTRADDPAVHPPGTEAWFVLVNAPRHGTDWSAVDWRRAGLAEAYGKHVLDALARRGLDVRDRLIFAEIRTPADLADAAAAPGGAIYGTSGGLMRPANRGPVDNLFLVGGSVHPGGGLPMVTLSAKIVADEIGKYSPA